MSHGYYSADGSNLPMQDRCHEWWATERCVDEYVDENIVRHLIADGDMREAVLLVTRPHWISRQLERCTILSFERDVDLMTIAFETISEAVADPNDTLEGPSLVRNSVRAVLSAILGNPREVCVQVSARMVYVNEC